ncbi:hypothetical protein V6Z93_010536 [Aspergillus fumigatus]
MVWLFLFFTVGEPESFDFTSGCGCLSFRRMPCLPRFASRGRREVLASDLHSPIRKDLTTRISHRLDFRSEFPCASGLLSTPANSENTALSPVVSALAPNPGIQRRNAIYPERTFALFTSREGLFP